MGFNSIYKEVFLLHHGITREKLIFQPMAAEEASTSVLPFLVASLPLFPLSPFLLPHLQQEV